MSLRPDIATARLRRQARHDERGDGDGKATQPAPEAKPGKRRLSFHEKHALETLPRQIAVLQGRIGQLQQRFDDPNLYARDREAFAEVSNSLAAAQLELASAEEKWLKLEILREEIEGQ